MPVAAPKGRIFLKKSLLHVKSKSLRLGVVVGCIDLCQREAVDVSVPEQHLEQRLAAVGRIRRENFGRPNLVRRKALREFHHLPDIRPRFGRRLDKLVPELGAPLRVAVGALFFDPHCRR